jgi:heme oxygenase
MAKALDRALVGPARCALVLVDVLRDTAALERELGRRHYCRLFGLLAAGAELDRLLRLYLAAELLEAALRYYFESLHSAALETFA